MLKKIVGFYIAIFLIFLVAFGIESTLEVHAKEIKVIQNTYIVPDEVPDPMESVGEGSFVFYEEGFGIFSFIGTTSNRELISVLIGVESGGEGEQNRVYIIGIFYDSGKKSGSFFDMQYVRIGVPSFKLEKVEEIPSLKTLVDIKTGKQKATEI